MSIKQPQPTNNNYPFQVDEHYALSLNSMNRVYTKHPDFKPGMKLIYELLFDYYNPHYGYAFPTIPQLERDSMLGNATVKRHLRALEKLDLIERRKSPTHGNNVYVVKKPVTTLEGLYAKFPEIQTDVEKRLEKIEAGAKSDKERLSAYRKEAEEPNEGEEGAEEPVFSITIEGDDDPEGWEF
ncbi:helix-turn-helix domain-containing protein [Salimicrobium humidisoli]|uniref:Helix-turn-helix domain-containing protein n=1 Tax=Salimicrobium humidisoli TaxID=2029857 RepID=A0ABX4HRS1_9BACI|nr:helix-turn-helix domain-containing protein [Salimicrobium humidisoli]PBB05743.1 hypothetical protein CKW00_07010 [Salimicrobium humidisoli]